MVYFCSCVERENTYKIHSYALYKIFKLVNSNISENKLIFILKRDVQDNLMQLCSKIPFCPIELFRNAITLLFH